MTDFYSFRSDMRFTIQAEDSLQPTLVEGMCHNNLTDNKIVCRLPRNRKSSEIIFVSLQDFNRNWFAQYMLVSPRVQELLADINATGYELRDVVDMRLGFEHAPADRNYKQLVVVGWGGLPAEESGIRRFDGEYGPFCFSMATDPTKILDREQWDGSDIFRIWPLGGFVTGRVYNVLQKHRIKHITLKPIEKINPEAPWGDGVTAFVGTPLRLLYPEDRAKEIGEPLGIY